MNNLTPAQHERLAILSEECGEVVQAIGKIFRHGVDSYSPNDPDRTTNLVLLETELFDVLATVNAMVSEGDLQQTMLANENERTQAAWEKKKRYTHYQK